MTLRILLLSATLFSLGALGAEKPVDVRDLMTANQFHATGLDKLAPEQLAAFDAWLAAYSYPAVASKAPDVRDLVSANQYHAIGFDKLAPEELAAFNAWLTAYRPNSIPAAGPAVPAAVAAAVPVQAATSDNASFGQEMLSGDELGEPERIESRIVGTFTGWNGHTTFKLENGQVWQQTDSGSYETRLDNPAVVIKRLSFGYLLTLSGHGATVFVRRVH